MLRAQKVVGKFVEFYGEGAASLPVPDRATIGNMSPEYGATMGFFPIDAGIGQLFARDRPHRRTMRRVRKLFPRAKNVRHAAQRRDRLQRRSRIGSRRRAAGRGRTEAAAGSNQSSGIRRDISIASAKTGHGWRLRKTRRRSRAKHLGPTERHRRRPTARCLRPIKARPGHRAGRRAQQTRDGVQSPDAGHGARIEGSNRPIRFITGKAGSATAAF